MYRIETLGLGTRKVPHLHCNDLEAGGLEARNDLSDDVLFDRIGLEDGKRTFNCHVLPLREL